MIWKTKERLLAGEAVPGYFEIAGTDEPLPGHMHWTPESGARIEVVDPRWQRPINTEHLTVHGLLGESDPVTLLDAIVRAGASMEPPEWRHNALLFYAGELPDFRLSIVRWWRLYEKTRPALGISATTSTRASPSRARA